MIQMTEQEFQLISSFIRKNYGINLEKKKYLIESKLWIELARAHVTTYSEYWQLLLADAGGEMQRRMIDLLTTNYSYFMREEKHFEFIRSTVLPQMRQLPGSTLRILCAGCAAGQEAYTLVMYLLDARQEGSLKVPFDIIGLDISAKSLQRARKGTYGSEEYARLPQRWRDCYCEPFREGQFTLRGVVKEKVRFFPYNLMEPLVSCREMFQLVLCRNVLIYIQEPERKRILGNIVDTLRPDGYLFVGHTESLMQSVPGLCYVQPAVYRKGADSSCRG